MSNFQGASNSAGQLSFIYGHVAPTLFPVEQLQQASAIALAARDRAALNYGHSMGYKPLRDYLREKFARDEGLQLESGELMLTAGASAGLDMLIRVFTRPGDTVLVEAPSYHEALKVIRDYPVKLVEVSLDEDGLQIDALSAQLARLKLAGERPALLYTIPTFHNPSGVTLNLVRRVRLLELATQHELLVLEDDVYHDLHFDRPAPASLYSLDTEDLVIRLGSFSKILAPGLRLGWFIGAEERLAQLAHSGLVSSGGGANPFVACTVAAFCEQNWLEPHIEELRLNYRRRRDLMLETLADHMPAEVTWTHPAGGFFVWLTLPTSLPARVVVEDAREQGISLISGEPFFAVDPHAGRHNLRLSYSYLDLDDLARGVRVVAELIGKRLVRGR